MRPGAGEALTPGEKQFLWALSNWGVKLVALRYPCHIGKTAYVVTGVRMYTYDLPSPFAMEPSLWFLIEQGYIGIQYQVASPGGDAPHTNVYVITEKGLGVVEAEKMEAQAA